LEFLEGTGDEDEIESLFGEGEGEGFSYSGGWTRYDCVGWTIAFTEFLDLYQLERKNMECYTHSGDEDSVKETEEGEGVVNRGDDAN